MGPNDQKQKRLVIREIRQETPEIKSFRFALGSEGPFIFLPGQFVIISAEVWNPKRNRMAPANRAFSLSSSPTEVDFIEIAAKRYESGRITPWLHDTVKVGDFVNVKGPEGRFVFKPGEANEIILIAGGIGIAPYRGMIRYILDKEIPVTIKLLYSARTPEDFAFAAELQNLERQHPNLQCTFTITRPRGPAWPGRVGRFDEAFFREHSGPANALYYLCGPAAMIKEHSRILKGLGVPESSIRVEPW